METGNELYYQVPIYRVLHTVMIQNTLDNLALMVNCHETARCNTHKVDQVLRLHFWLSCTSTKTK